MKYCNECIFWDNDSVINSEYGCCHIGTPIDFKGFARTHKFDWCREFLNTDLEKLEIMEILEWKKSKINNG